MDEIQELITDWESAADMVEEAIAGQSNLKLSKGMRMGRKAFLHIRMYFAKNDPDSINEDLRKRILILGEKWTALSEQAIIWQRQIKVKIDGRGRARRITNAYGTGRKSASLKGRNVLLRAGKKFK